MISDLNKAISLTFLTILGLFVQFSGQSQAFFAYPDISYDGQRLIITQLKTSGANEIVMNLVNTGRKTVSGSDFSNQTVILRSRDEVTQADLSTYYEALANQNFSIDAGGQLKAFSLKLNAKLVQAPLKKDKTKKENKAPKVKKNTADSMVAKNSKATKEKKAKEEKAVVEKKVQSSKKTEKSEKVAKVKKVKSSKKKINPEEKVAAIDVESKIEKEEIEKELNLLAEDLEEDLIETQTEVVAEEKTDVKAEVDEAAKPVSEAEAPIDLKTEAKVESSQEIFEEENEAPFLSICADISISAIKIIKQTKKNIQVSYTLVNNGKGKANLKSSPDQSDDLAISVFLSSAKTISRGSIPVGGEFIDIEKGKEILAPGETHQGEMKIQLYKFTKFTPYLILQVDPYQKIMECNETNNLNSVYLLDN